MNNMNADFTLCEYPDDPTRCLVKPVSEAAKNAILKWNLAPNYGSYHVFLSNRTEAAFYLMRFGFSIKLNVVESES